MHLFFRNISLFHPRDDVLQYMHVSVAPVLHIFILEAAVLLNQYPVEVSLADLPELGHRGRLREQEP